jgi:hypothetical protein
MQQHDPLLLKSLTRKTKRLYFSALCVTFILWGKLPMVYPYLTIDGIA